MPQKIEEQHKMSNHSPIYVCHQSVLQVSFFFMRPVATHGGKLKVLALAMKGHTRTQMIT